MFLAGVHALHSVVVAENDIDLLLHFLFLHLIHELHEVDSGSVFFLSPHSLLGKVGIHGDELFTAKDLDR